MNRYFIVSYIGIKDETFEQGVHELVTRNGKFISKDQTKEEISWKGYSWVDITNILEISEEDSFTWMEDWNN